MTPDSLRQLIANCRKKTVRTLGWPRDWQPQTVRRPHGDDFFPYFNDSSAWELIADKLDEGHSYQEIELDNPKGAPAIQMEIQHSMKPTDPKLYVKIQVGAGNVPIGRSFHHSDYSRNAA
jgi:hypothetical protein